jgi:hypothetical protein
MMNMQCDGLKLVQRETIRQTGSEGLFISKQSCAAGNSSNFEVRIAAPGADAEGKPSQSFS